MLMLERLKYIAAVVLYGTIGLFLRQISLPSEAAALCRGIIGAGFIFLFLVLRKQKPDRDAIRRELRLLLLSGFFLGLNWIFLFAAYIKTTVAIASLCNYTAPAIVILIAPFVLREPLNLRKLPCAAAAVIGIVLVSGVPGGERGNPAGIALGLAAALCFVGIVVCNRKMRTVTAYDRAMVQLITAAATILPYVVLHNIGKPVSVDLRSVVIVLVLGVVHTGVAYCLYFSGMAKLPVQTVAVLGYLEPVVSVLCSVLFLQEKLPLIGWIGAVLVIAAAAAGELIGNDDNHPACNSTIDKKSGG